MSRTLALSAPQARQLLSLSAQGMSDAALATQFGICKKTVERIRKGQIYTEITGVVLKHGRPGHPRKLSAEQAAEVIDRFRRGMSRSSIARELGVGRGVVDRVVSGRGYSDVTGVVSQQSRSPEGVAATRNVQAVRRVRTSVACVSCGKTLGRRVMAVMKAHGVVFCLRCDPGVQ